MARQVGLHRFSGKLDATVGYKFYKNMCERMNTTKKSWTFTTKQLQVQSKFALLNKFLLKITGFCSVTFKNSNGPWRGEAFKANFDVAFGGTYPNYELAYDKIIVARGSVDNPYNPSAVVESNVLNISWTDNSGAGTAVETDHSCILAYNSAKEQAIFTLAGGDRVECLASLTLPTAWSGDSVDVWFCMKASDTNTVQGFSDSMYLGNISI